MFYKVGFFVLLGIALFVAGSQVARLYPSSTPAPTPTSVLMEETTSSPTIAASPTTNPTSDMEDIRIAMAAKFGKNPSDVTLEISKKTSIHAWGGAKFTGEIAGGWFLAYKGTNGWIIVDSGNGTISCETIAPYNFPVSMVEECVNASGQLIRR